MLAEVSIMQRLRGSPYVVALHESVETALPLDEANPGALPRALASAAPRTPCRASARISASRREPSAHPPALIPPARPCAAGRNIDVFIIILEYACGGDVMTRIEDFLERKAHFSERTAARMFKQMLLAVQHCHKNVRGPDLLRARARARDKACWPAPLTAPMTAALPSVTRSHPPPLPPPLRAGRRAPRPEARELPAGEQGARRRREADGLWPLGRAAVARRGPARAVRLRVLHRARDPLQDGLRRARRCVARAGVAGSGETPPPPPFPPALTPPSAAAARFARARADNFALGVILYIMLSGTVPFGDGNRAEKEIYRAIQHDELHFGGGWASITGAAKELISGLLEKDPAKRYTTEQALAHAWVSGDAASDRPIDRAVIDGLLAYNARNHMKRAAVHLVASHLTAKDVQSLRATFMKMDTDGSGTITRAEMASAMRDMGVAERDPGVFKRIVDAVDADGDGRISWEEFLEASLEPQMVKYQQQVWQAFCAMDTDGDGHISIAELKEILKDEPVDKIEKYIAEFDLNKDGNIDYEEFLRMLLPKNIKFRVHATS